MKHTRYRYILFALLITIMTTAKVLAVEVTHNFADSIYATANKRTEICYYLHNEFKAILAVNTGKTLAGIANTNDTYTSVLINKVGAKPDKNPEKVLNWINGSWHSHKTTKNGTTQVEFPALYADEADAAANGTCPKYLVIQYCRAYKIWGVDGDNAENLSNQAVEAINSDHKCSGYKATFEHSDGTKITQEEYFSSFVRKDLGGEKIFNLKCYGENSIFGNKDDAGDEKENRPPSLAYMIDSALVYVKIIVPILIILLGTIDLAKAALASDQEKTKKAQKDFIKRIALGVAVFFIPTIVRILMNMADLVWAGLDYSTPCLLP